MLIWFFKFPLCSQSIIIKKYIFFLLKRKVYLNWKGKILIKIMRMRCRLNHGSSLKKFGVVLANIYKCALWLYIFSFTPIVILFKTGASTIFSPNWLLNWIISTISLLDNVLESFFYRFTFKELLNLHLSRLPLFES